MITRYTAVLTALIFVTIYAIWHNTDLVQPLSTAPGHSTPLGDTNLEKVALPTPKNTKGHTPTKSDPNYPLSSHVLDYFDQVFSIDKPAPYAFFALQQQCKRTKWLQDDVYLDCASIVAGLTTIMSQVKVCLKMAIEAGTGIVLPSMALRDSKDLKEFNLFNGDAHLAYDKWFDAEHLIDQLERACPLMKVIYRDQMDSGLLPVKYQWQIDYSKAPGFVQFQGYFWTGRPFKAFFDQQYADLQLAAFLDPNRDDSKSGITVIRIETAFLMFKLTDDPTGQDVKVWNDLSHLIRFKEAPRQIVNQLLSRISRPFYGIHFRVESDTIWSSLDNQLSVDLDALDKAWAKYGTADGQKPLVYLACGDQEQVEKFVSAGMARGWEVTHKWDLAKSDADILKKINELPFDFQGAVDMGIMIKSHFFLGIQGSAFSSTIANVRDVTGRYRGSSLTVFDDENARTHLFNDNDASAYPCCL